MPAEIFSKNNYEILHDRNKILCFVGYSSLSKACYSLVALHRAAENISLESALAQTKDWLDARQFIVISSDVKFKQQAVESLTQKSVDFFSLVSNSNYFNPNVQIGQGTWISTFNSFEIGHTTVGNHCCIHTHNTFGDGCYIGDYCNIGHWGFYTNCSVGAGSVFGVKVFVANVDITDANLITVAPYTNVLSESRITKHIAQSGTYYHNRKVNDLTSLQQRIL